MSKPVIVAVAALLVLGGCGRSDVDLAIHGDSTAIGTRDGMGKVLAIAPSLDGARWWNVIARDPDRPRVVFNDGKGSQDIKNMTGRMGVDMPYLDRTTILYDRRNKGEGPHHYVNDLAVAVGLLTTERFLIMPQVARTNGLDDAEQMRAMAYIDAAVMQRWPNNTFSPEEREKFIAALSDPSTRFDGLHRNAKGQQIEAEFIGEWLNARGW